MLQALLNSRSVISDRPEFANHIKNVEKSALEIETRLNAIIQDQPANQKWGEARKVELNDISILF
jgi:hypothetical protein